MVPFYSALMRHIWSPVSSSGFSRCTHVMLWICDTMIQQIITTTEGFYIQIEAERAEAELRLFRLEKGMLRVVSAMHNNTWWESKENFFQQYPVIRQEPMATNWNTNISINKRKAFFTQRVLVLWNRFPREAVKCPSLELVQTWLDRILSNLF